MQVKFLSIGERYRILNKLDLKTQFAYKCTFEISDKRDPVLESIAVPVPDFCTGLKNEPIRCYTGKIKFLVILTHIRHIWLHAIKTNNF